jgi:hypothetical protein
LKQTSTIPNPPPNLSGCEGLDRNAMSVFPNDIQPLLKAESPATCWGKHFAPPQVIDPTNPLSLKEHPLLTDSPQLSIRPLSCSNTERSWMSEPNTFTHKIDNFCVQK